jgi:hypothetical protein
MYEAVKALITEISPVKFSVVTIQQNVIFLPTYMLYDIPLLPVILNRSSNTKELITMHL